MNLTEEERNSVWKRVKVVPWSSSWSTSCSKSQSTTIDKDPGIKIRSIKSKTYTANSKMNPSQSKYKKKYYQCSF